VDGEEWRAEAVDGRPVAEGATIRVIEVRGTRALVVPFEAPVPDGPLPD
jgi:membrane-bound ClpP family serine protease